MSDIESIKSCWSKVKSTKGTDFFVEHFYQHMFEHHPDTQALFPKDLAQQKTTLLTTLDNVINGFEYIEDLEEELLSLGKHHKNLNIKKEMFDGFISTIVAVANLSSDFSLTEKELTVWEGAFRKVSDIMLKAY